MKTILSGFALLLIFLGTAPRIISYDRGHKVLWHNPAFYYEPEKDPQTKSLNEGVSLGADFFFAGAIALVSAGLIRRGIN